MAYSSMIYFITATEFPFQIFGSLGIVYKFKLKNSISVKSGYPLIIQNLYIVK